MILENRRAALSDADLAGAFDCRWEMAQAVVDPPAKSGNPLQPVRRVQGAEQGAADESRLEKARPFAREVVEGFRGNA